MSFRYVIQRHDGQYVTPSGNLRSYTKDLRQARRFADEAAARRELCPDNERVVTVESQLDQRGG